MEPILKAADQNNVYVIEDAAQAIGAQNEKGRQAGTMGDIGCFSFFPSKNLGAFGDGGMVITDNEKLAGLLNVLRVHGAEPKYYHKIVGGNFRLDALQAAILRVKLKYLAQWSDKRRQVASRYRRLFEEMGLLDRVSLLKDSPGHIYHQFVARFPERDRLQAFLRDKGIETAVYYPVPLHLQDCLRELGYRRGDFPHSEKRCGGIPGAADLSGIDCESIRNTSSSKSKNFILRVKELATRAKTQSMSLGRVEGNAKFR